MKTLHELAEVKRGKSRHRPRTAAAFYGGSHPFIQTADIHASEFRILKCSQSYSDFGLAQSKKWKAGTLCITNAGENTGDCAILGFDACFPDSIIGITPLEGKADVRFLKYSLDLLRPQLRTVTKGATQDNLSVAILLSFPFPAPDLPTQHKIAGILSAYDDLIENDLRRIKILEQMAQALYREWFVQFRFPGHESAKFVDSELGLIPKGWEVRKLGQVGKIVMGLSPKGDTYNDQGDGMPLVNGPVEFSDRFTKRIKWTTSPTKTCKAGDLVVCVRGSTTGKNVKSDGEYCLGRGVCSISSEHQSFVDQMFANELPTLLGMTGGSTFPSWTGPVLQSHPVISPSGNLVAEFDRMTLPMSDTIQSLAFMNDNLRRTRDLLLPKLLSGDRASFRAGNPQENLEKSPRNT